MPQEERKNSIANLKPLGTGKLSAEAERAIRSAGGKASARVQHERKAFRKTVEEILAMPAVFNGKQLKDPVTGQPLDNMQSAVIVATLKEALKGDCKAADKIVEWLGEANTPAGVTINVALGK